MKTRESKKDGYHSLYVTWRISLLRYRNLPVSGLALFLLLYGFFFFTKYQVSETKSIFQRYDMTYSNAQNKGSNRSALEASNHSNTILPRAGVITL